MSPDPRQPPADFTPQQAMGWLVNTMESVWTRQAAKVVLFVVIGFFLTIGTFIGFLIVTHERMLKTTQIINGLKMQVDSNRDVIKALEADQIQRNHQYEVLLKALETTRKEKRR